jgi:hypothetical protein
MKAIELLHGIKNTEITYQAVQNFVIFSIHMVSQMKSGLPSRLLLSTLPFDPY